MHHFPSGTTVPEPHSSSLHLGFASEGKNAFGMLVHFCFLHHFPEGDALMDPVYFLTVSDLLGAFS